MEQWRRISSSRKGGLCPSRVLPLSEDMPNIWRLLPKHVANAEDLLPSEDRSHVPGTVGVDSED